MKKFLCALLAVMLVVSCFAACGSKEDKNDESKAPADDSKVESNASDTDASNGSDVAGSEDDDDDSWGAGADDDDSSAPADDVIYSELLPEAVDMGGREFYILQRWFGYNKPTIEFQGEVIWEDSEDGTMTNINAAKAEVLEKVQKAYNCTITGEMSTESAADIRTLLNQDILGETGDYDFCFETYFYYYAFVQDGLLVDLNTLDMDLEAAWWDQNAVKDLSVCNKLYYALGDINTYDNDGTFVVLFNKDLYIENGGDPQYLYDLAANGDWTFDELEKIVTGFGTDSKADGIRDEFDTYGLLTETSNLYLHVLASGNKSVEKNSNDEPEFALQNEDVFEAQIAAVELYLNSTDVLVADLEVYETKYEGEDVYENTVTNAFKEGRGLFYMTGLIHLPYFRDMADDYGILPFPKYSAEQDRYYHNMSPHTASCVFVPIGPNSNGEAGKQIGIILDALGAYSKDILTPVYYEGQLKRGDAQDAQSAEMLDIIFGSRVFDLGAVFGSAWNVIDICNELNTNMASRVDSMKDVIEANIMMSVEAIKDNE